jgi:hypothetical protein
VTPFVDQVDNGPMIFAALEMLDGQFSQLPPSQTATQQNRQYGSIPLPFHSLRIRQLPKHASLLCGQPIPQSAPESLRTFHPANAGGKIRA